MLNQYINHPHQNLPYKPKPKPTQPHLTLTIRNQPFDAASQYPNGFFYNVAISFDGKNWNELYHVEDAEDWYPQQSNYSTTVLTYIAGETIYYPKDTSQWVGGIPKSGEVAFQVQAMIGHRDRGAFKNGFMPYVFVGETSDWSNIRTITILSSELSPTPFIPELSWLVILPLLLVVLVFLVAKLFRKRNSFLCRENQLFSKGKIQKYPNACMSYLLYYRV